MIDYGLLPLEINSARIYAGPGATSLLDAAVAWSGLASDLQAAASGHRSVVTGLTSAFGQVASADTALATFSKSAAPAAAAGNAAKAAAAAVSKVGSASVGTGKALPGGLSVPTSWSTVGETAGGPVASSLTNATTVPTAEEGATKGLPTAPPFGRFVNGSGGRKTPAYGYRLTFMTKQPAAG